MRTQSLKVLHLKPGVGQCIAINTTRTASDFFLANFYPSGPFACIFFQNLAQVFPVLAVANTSSCVGPQNKIQVNLLIVTDNCCRCLVLSSRGILIGSKTCVIVFLVLRSEIVDRI